MTPDTQRYLVRAPGDLGHTIRIARRRAKLTQKQLSALSGVRQGTVSNVERGVGDPKLDTIFALLAALDLELTVTTRSKGSIDAIEDIF